MPGYKKPRAPARRKPSPKAKAVRKTVGYAKAKVYPPAEIKFFDSSFPQSFIPAGPASLIDSTMVAEIINGTGPQSRIGRKIKVVKVDFSATLTANGGTLTTNTEAIRFDIWLDKQCNGAAPGPTDLYTALAGPLGTCQMPNLFNERRFVRLYTHTHQFNSQNATALGVPCDIGYKFEGSITPNCVIEYDATAGAITDLTSNNLFTCWSCDRGAGLTTSLFTRVHFTDA